MYFVSIIYKNFSNNCAFVTKPNIDLQNPLIFSMHNCSVALSGIFVSLDIGDKNEKILSSHDLL